MSIAAPRILLDACVPHGFRRELADLDVTTAQFAGLDQIPDGELLTILAGRYDVLVTLDTNMVRQNTMVGRPFAVIVMRVAEQSPEAFRALVPKVRDAIAAARVGEVQIVA